MFNKSDMKRLKKSSIVNSSSIPTTLTMTSEQKILFLANLIIDRIFADQHKDKKIFE